MPKWYGGSTLNPDETVQPKNQWINQFNRVKRWYTCVQTLKNKCEKEMLTENDIDIIIAFFQNCYHLSDWIKSSRPELKEETNKLFKNIFEMGACRDICNGFKHKEYKSPSLDAEFNLYREYDHFALKGQNPVHYNIAFANDKNIKKYNVFDLVDLCLNNWIIFLKSNNLLITN